MIKLISSLPPKLPDCQKIVKDCCKEQAKNIMRGMKKDIIRQHAYYKLTGPCDRALDFMAESIVSSI